jgi:hypothetical protein
VDIYVGTYFSKCVPWIGMASSRKVLDMRWACGVKVELHKPAESLSCIAQPFFGVHLYDLLRLSQIASKPSQ